MARDESVLPVVIVAGPTASGKSELALDLAEAFEGTVINADSMQIYRELAVLTARPGPAEDARAPHRLYGVLPGAEPCSAGRWRALALAEIARAHAVGRLPILAGGTGLYLRALEHGLSAIPPVPPEARAAARARHADMGGPAFHAALAARDSETASRLHPSDSQRLIRAWEVLEATGLPLSAWQRRSKGAGLPHRRLRLVLAPPRPVLYEACDRRFLRMMGAGALDEVRSLLALRLDPSLPVMKALGVPQIAGCLTGEIAKETAVAAAQQATRRYAKRQLTWLRTQMIGGLHMPSDSAPSPAPAGDDTWLLSAQYSETLRPRIFKIIREFLLTHPN